MDRSRILKLVLVIAIVVLLGNAVVISRDYQDSWILEGLEIPFLLFVAVYALAFFSEKRVSLMVILAVVGRCVFLLVPNLKYVWFQGIAIDQHVQYGLANHVCNEGYISTQDIFGVQVYRNTPLIHLTFAIFSTVLSIPVVESVKYLPVFLSPIYPLLTYVIMKKMKLPQEVTALKYALFISSIPINAEKYVVTGGQFGAVVTFLCLTSLVILLNKNDRRHWILFIFFILVLAATHSSSSVLLTMFLLTIMLLQKTSYFRLKSYIQAPAVFAVSLICGVWLMFPAGFTFERIVLVLVNALGGVETPAAGPIPPRFYELARLDTLGALNSILVFKGIEVFLLLLNLGGLIVLLRMRKRVNNTSNFLFLISGVMLSLIPLGLLLKVGAFRATHLASLLFPIFSSIFIYYAGKRRVYMRAVMFSLIILLATIQLYRCQPLIPSANTLSKDLPTDEPLVYVTTVNSIYQRQMIEFASDYVGGRIVSDHVTRNQIIGLTEFDFSAHLTWFYPLDKYQSKETHDCFLIHLPGASGGFDDRAEVRTRDLILEAIYNSSIIYTNGESYILRS